MRLMLGTPGKPSLLVTVDDDFNPTSFDFSVINGAWAGEFTHGHVTVFMPRGDDWSSLDIPYILTEDQDRLRGNNSWDYQTVFDNWDNPAYVGPVWEKVVYADMDDDIAF
jgi:hypothetical protein